MHRAASSMCSIARNSSHLNEQTQLQNSEGVAYRSNDILSSSTALCTHVRPAPG